MPPKNLQLCGTVDDSGKKKKNELVLVRKYLRFHSEEVRKLKHNSILIKYILTSITLIFDNSNNFLYCLGLYMTEIHLEYNDRKNNF